MSQHQFAAPVTHSMAPVAGIEPRDGRQLLTFEYQDSDGFLSPAYAVTGEGRPRLLNVSRFNFVPTQARFDWLVQNLDHPGQIGPRHGECGPLDDAFIDKMITLADRKAM